MSRTQEFFTGMGVLVRIFRGLVSGFIGLLLKNLLGKLPGPDTVYR